MAQRYWVAGGTGNWNSTTNWSASSGGGSGASFPTSVDDAIFDANSDIGVASVNVSSACLTLVCTNFAGTLNFQNTLTVSGSITLGASMSFSNTSGTPLLVANATGTHTSNGKTFPYELSLRGLSTHTFADNWRVQNLSLNSGSSLITILGNRTITIDGNFNDGMSGPKFATGTTFVLAGTGTWSNTSVGVLRANVTINTSGTITISSNVRITDGTLTYTSGTVITTGSTIIIGGVNSTSLTLNTSGMIWNNVQWTQNGLTHNLTSNFTFSGSIIGAGSVTATFNTANGSKIICSSGTIALAGGTALQGSSKLEIIGNSNWDGTNSGRVAMDVDVNCTTLNFSAGVVRWSGNGKTFKWVAGTPTGNFDITLMASTGTHTLDLNGQTVRNFIGSMNTTSVVVSFASEIKVSGQFYLNTITSSTTTNTFNSTSVGVQRKITLLQGCLIDVGPFVNFTDITAQDGKTIWVYKPTLSNTTNIRSLPLELSTIGTVN